jgi:hypothetical protein
VTIALVTSIYGNYDHLTDPPEQEGVIDYVAVVDEVKAGPSLWRQIVEPRPHMHPRLAAKVAKCCPLLYTDADYTVWVDGSARLKHKGVAKWAVDQLGLAHAAQFPHPDRIDIDPEAVVSMGMGKYNGQSCMDQAAYYKKQGLPQNFGLWATGFIARPRWAGMDRRWLAEQIRWSYQDQISLPYVYWLTNGPPALLLEGNLWSNPHVYFDAHFSGA